MEMPDQSDHAESAMGRGSAVPDIYQHGSRQSDITKVGGTIPRPRQRGPDQLSAEMGRAISFIKARGKENTFFRGWAGLDWVGPCRGSQPDQKGSENPPFTVAMIDPRHIEQGADGAGGGADHRGAFRSIQWNECPR